MWNSEEEVEENVMNNKLWDSKEGKLNCHDKLKEVRQELDKIDDIVGEATEEIRTTIEDLQQKLNTLQINGTSN